MEIAWSDLEKRFETPEGIALLKASGLRGANGFKSFWQMGEEQDESPVVLFGRFMNQAQDFISGAASMSTFDD